MPSLRRATIRGIAQLSPRYLPFADVASETLPLKKLLRLSLLQVTVGMALVLLVGTLNRVMIVELSVPATIVGVMLALPVIFAPLRVLIGHASDTYISPLGWRRVPFIWKGTLCQFGGLAIMPFALLVLAGKGESHNAPAFLGIGASALSFVLVGAGVHMVQTVGLALATDLAPQKDQPKVVGLMFVAMLVGMIISALVFGALLVDFVAGRLIQVIQGAAVVTVVLNLVAIWKMEPRVRGRDREDINQPSFQRAIAAFMDQPFSRPRLAVIAIGTLGFGMADILLEPYGGQVLELTVAQTTRLTATFAVGGLLGLALASRLTRHVGEPLWMAALGLVMGLPAFALVAFAATAQSTEMFAAGTLLIGFGAGLFGHGTLSSVIRHARPGEVGLACGAWGAVQSTAAGAALALGSVLRDVGSAMPWSTAFNGAAPYFSVYAVELVLLVVALAVLLPQLGRMARGGADAGRLRHS
ncbi:MAG: MFS transporter [Pseudomonadota bacterium]